MLKCKVYNNMTPDYCIDRMGGGGGGGGGGGIHCNTEKQQVSSSF